MKAAALKLAQELLEIVKRPWTVAMVTRYHEGYCICCQMVKEILIFTMILNEFRAVLTRIAIRNEKYSLKNWWENCIFTVSKVVGGRKTSRRLSGECFK